MNFAGKKALLSAAAIMTVLAGGVAQAHDERGYAPARGHGYEADRYGSADPCRRTAGNRALGWGIVGLLAGGVAGSAVAAAGVAAEGAALGALVGGVIGAKAGYSSAQCEQAAYWNHPAYRSYADEGYSTSYGGDDYRYDDYAGDLYSDRYESRAPLTYYEHQVGPRSSYEYRSSYSSTSAYDDRARYSRDDHHFDRDRCCDDPRPHEHHDRDDHRSRYGAERGRY